MVRLEAETNIEVLRQTARLLLAENERLHTRLLALTRDLAVARGQVATQLELEIGRLQEELARRTRALFGPSSEKRPAADAQAANETPAAGAQRGHGPHAQAALPLVERVHELEVPDQICPACGGALQAWAEQFEEAEEIDIVERSFRIIKHRRQKYRCRCGGCVETALGPPKLIPGGRYSVEFAVAAAIAKYTDHLPLARQVRQMERLGLHVDTQTLWDQLWALSRHLLPTYKALHAYVLAAPVIGADETTWPLLEKGQTRKWWAWAVTRPDAVCYRILATRSAAAAGTVLAGYCGIVVVDGYSAYRTLQKERAAGGTPSFILASCMAHARRTFVEAEPDYPQATEMLVHFRELYRIEAQARTVVETERLRLLAELRRTQSRAVMQQMSEWLMAHRRTVLPRSGLGKAISYTLELWASLSLFLDNAAIPIDNNQTERAIRGVAVGRKNHYGSRSLRGTEVAAIFYSLIESAKLAGVEPAHYLREATLRAITTPGTVTLPTDLQALRPNTS